jgi:hypothetical protein
VVVHDEGALRVEVVEERLDAVGLAGVEDEVEIRLAERPDGLVAGEVEDETFAMGEEAEVGGKGRRIHDGDVDPDALEPRRHGGLGASPIAIGVDVGGEHDP